MLQDETCFLNGVGGGLEFLSSSSGRDRSSPLGASAEGPASPLQRETLLNGVPVPDDQGFAESVESGPFEPERVTELESSLREQQRVLCQLLASENIDDVGADKEDLSTAGDGSFGIPSPAGSLRASRPLVPSLQLQSAGLPTGNAKEGMGLGTTWSGSAGSSPRDGAAHPAVSKFDHTSELQWPSFASTGVSPGLSRSRSPSPSQNGAEENGALECLRAELSQLRGELEHLKSREPELEQLRTLYDAAVARCQQHEVRSWRLELRCEQLEGRSNRTVLAAELDQLKTRRAEMVQQLKSMEEAAAARTWSREAEVRRLEQRGDDLKTRLCDLWQVEAELRHELAVLREMSRLRQGQERRAHERHAPFGMEVQSLR